MTDHPLTLADLRAVLHDPRIPSETPVFVRVVDRSRGDGHYSAVEHPIVAGITAYRDGRVMILAVARPGDLARAADGASADHLQLLVRFLSSIDTDESGASAGWRAGAKEALGAADTLADIIGEALALLRRDAGLPEQPEPPPPPDPRICYGALCSWWGSIYEASSSGSDLPCCPHCRKPLMEVASEEVWWRGASIPNDRGPRYPEFIRWLRGRCYRTLDIAWSAFLAERPQAPT